MTKERAPGTPRIFVAVPSIELFDPYYFDEHGVGVEIQDLIPWNMSASAAADIVSRYRERLVRFRGPIAVHAPVPHELRPDEEALARFRSAAAQASSLGASVLILHSGITDTSADALSRLASFWGMLRSDLENAHMTAALENVLEDDYHPLLSLVRRIDAPSIGVCFDIGHQHLNSRQFIEEWLFNLSHHIRHVHIHANNGADDEHRALSDVSLRRFMRLCTDHDIAPNISFEYRGITAERIKSEAARIRSAVGHAAMPRHSFKELRPFILQIALPAAIALSLFTALIFGFIIPRYERIIIDQKRSMLRELVRSAASIAERLDADVRAERLTADAARREAAILIGKMRYGPERKDYFWVTDMHPRMIVHPYRSDLNGTDLSSFTDPGGKKLFVEFVAAVRTNSGGFVEYRWQWKDDPSAVVPKLSYVERFAPWGWIIGTGMYIDDVKDEIARIEQRLIVISAAISLLVALLLAFLARAGYRIDSRRRMTEESLRAAREKYRLLAEASTEGILMCSGKNIIFSNGPVRDMLGWSEDELSSLDAGTIVPASVFSTSSGGQPARTDGAVRTKSGIPFDAHIIASTVSFAGKEHLVIILRSTAMDDAPLRVYGPARITDDGIRSNDSEDSAVSNGSDVHASALIESIRTARSADEVRLFHDRIPAIAERYIGSPRRITAAMTRITDAIIARYCGLTESDIGPPPVPYSFITLGSAARGEQTLVSDQDNAIIFADGGPASYFRELGERVCMLLRKTGYAYCDGRIMAKSERWCQPLSRWKEYFAAWIRSGDPEDILDVSIFFDMRGVSGSMPDTLRPHIRSTLSGERPLIAHLARLAHSRSLPIGALGNLQPETIHGMRDAIDLKKVMLAAVDAARVFALKNGYAEMNTSARIARMKDDGILSPLDADAVIAAYGSLMDIRLRHQITLIRAGAEPDNIIALKHLHGFDHDMLRSAVSRIAVLQRLIEREFSIS